MYVCKDYNGNLFIASAGLSAALDNETIHGPINVPLALTVETGKTKWGVRFATNAWWRIVYHPEEGGYETFENVDGIGWVVTREMPEDVEEALCFAVGAHYVK